MQGAHHARGRFFAALRMTRWQSCLRLRSMGACCEPLGKEYHRRICRLVNADIRPPGFYARIIRTQSVYPISRSTCYPLQRPRPMQMPTFGQMGGRSSVSAGATAYVLVRRHTRNARHVNLHPRRIRLRSMRMQFYPG